MPASKLSDVPTTIQRFDVLVLAPVSDDFPLHLMLCNENDDRDDVTHVTFLNIVHMGPPLAEQRRERFFAFGSAELEERERPKIGAFVKERIAERAELRVLAKEAGQRWDSSAQYRIDPPVTRPSRDCTYWRYSCVGFVLAAYKSARIELLSQSRPLKDLQQIKAIYKNCDLGSSEFCERMGIGEGNQWPIALVGYVLNSLNRLPQEIRGEGASPFEPVDGDEYFPSRRGKPSSNPPGGAGKKSK